MMWVFRSRRGVGLGFFMAAYIQAQWRIVYNSKRLKRGSTGGSVWRLCPLIQERTKAGLTGGWIMDEPDAAPDFIGRELGPERFKPVAEARLGQQVFAEVSQLDPPAFGIQCQALAAELDRAHEEIAITGAPVFVAERVVADVVHAAEDQAVLSVNLPVQVNAEALGSQIVQEWFERVEVVVPEIGEDLGLAGGSHRGQVVGQHREELALAVEAAVFGQQITGDQDEAGLVLFD